MNRFLEHAIKSKAFIWSVNGIFMLHVLHMMVGQCRLVMTVISAWRVFIPSFIHGLKPANMVQFLFWNLFKDCDQKNLWANTFPRQPFNNIWENNLWENNLKLVLGPLYTRSQGGNKNLRPALSIFGLQIGPKLLINARTLAPRVANWPPKFDGVLFSALGPTQGHNDLDRQFYKPH